MPNAKKKWADNDVVLATLHFPYVAPPNRIESKGEYDLINGVQLPATGNYSYRCTKCNKYYPENKIHNCKN